jgi:hypothetical protein
MVTDRHEVPGPLLLDREPIGPALTYWPYVVTAMVFVASRIAYRIVFFVRFDASPFAYFMQYISPWFVQRDFLRSILYLSQQAPLQNLLVGGCVRIFGTPTAFKILDALYVASGLTTALSILHVMLRLGVSRAIATASAALYTASPVTAYFECWLLYHAPVLAFHLLSLVALLRYYRRGTLGAGILCFGLFALSGLFYANFGPIVLIAIALVLLVRPPRPDRAGISPRKRLIAALAIPLCMRGLDKAKTRLLIGHNQGDAYLWMNLAVKTYDWLRPGERQALAASGKISHAMGLFLFPISLSAYDDGMRIAHPTTGVPLLDMDLVPGGGVNAHSLEKVLIAERFYKKDALYLLAHDSDAYLRSVLNALTVQDFESPMDYDATLTAPNRENLQTLVNETNAIFLPDRNGTERLLVVLLPVLFLYGLYRVTGARGALESERSIAAAISFMLVLIAYVTLAMALVAVGDFSRYRYNIDPFYVILFALIATDCVEHARRAWRSVVSRLRVSLARRANA